MEQATTLSSSSTDPFLFSDSGAADVLSVDLGWSSATPGRTAVAYRALSGVKLASVSSEDELVERLCGLASPKALVLLDIPIEGCSSLGPNTPYRRLDRVLQRTQIPLLPSVKAQGRGASLRDRILAKRRDLRIEESYPYAALRVLWALKRLGSFHLGRDSFARVSLEGVWGDWPPKYKREPKLETRRAAAAEVAALLASHLPECEPVARLPEAVGKAGSSALADLSDQVDAALGLVAGIAAASGSPWSWKASLGEGGGSILTIADRWLRERFSASCGLLDL